jgi:hypothetical protein
VQASRSDYADERADHSYVRAAVSSARSGPTPKTSMSVVPDALTAAASLAFGVAPLGVQAAQVGEELAGELAASQVAGPDGEMRCSTLAARPR